MKKVIFITFILLITYLSDIYSQEIKMQSSQTQEKNDTLKGKTVKKFPFYIYYDAYSDINHFIPSGWGGDWGDLKCNGICRINPKKGIYCFQIKYSAQMKQKFGWSCIYWQNPAHNWGGMKGGYNLKKAKKVYFYARGGKGREKVEFNIGGIKGRFSDSIGHKSTGIVQLTTNWKLYEIDLADIDLSYISSGFSVILTRMNNPDGCTIYIDEPYYTDKYKIIVDNEVTLPIIKKDEITKVAIMDFENLSESKDLKYLSKIISEAISTSLGKNRDIKVLDSKSIQNHLKKLSMTVENFKTLNESTVLGKILGIDIIIRGSFLEIKNQILINIKLIDIETGLILAADQIKGSTGKGLFLLLDKTSQYIISQILKLNKSMN